MLRYFIEVAYKGTRYSGFQIQQNANSVQAEIGKAIKIFFREEISLTCSSRTDAGVHALSNYFHFDAAGLPEQTALNEIIYNLNSILPDDIVVKRIVEVSPTAHSRFDAVSREYQYNVYQTKDPFVADRAYYYPYKLEIDKLQEAAGVINDYTDFTSFSKRNTQVKTFNCKIIKSGWSITNNLAVYNVEANRFLRGMVRGLVGTMLKAGTGKISIDEFRGIIESKDCTKADFSVPPQGLFLLAVRYKFQI
ncbi:tRNA pseudouridine(38-40) synthase TruA [Ferruginibacter paludis]|uniref:tRNA pseudouridine(38-40) synthase TruA n=1 Tax=Ferruginibacter paludis TaxID=1310417 RepID=UPI0025B52B8B|nr:tRNA pseudouridine(38-40) synthase TruA [Ferruginibacter paludis]MDN3658783.1 tRNA pseudouridine(38-40) synthase TruA [Ferruginibacter paludis]